MIDFHLHTIYSDGEYTPFELIRLLRENNVTSFSLTDHDSTLGLKEMQVLADAYKMEFIPGVEFEAYYDIENEQYVHILGYNLSDLNEIDKYLVKLRNERINLIYEYIQLFHKIGMQISFDEINALTPGIHLTTSHIAACILKKKYVKTFEEARRKFLVPSSKYYIARNYYTTEFIIDLIVKSGGIPVLAHPCRIHMNSRKVEKFISQLKSYGLQGLEALYLCSTEEQKQYFELLAQDNGLFITAGSDWHTPKDNYNPGIKLPNEIESEMRANLKK